MGFAAMGAVFALAGAGQKCPAVHSSLSRALAIDTDLSFDAVALVP